MPELQRMMGAAGGAFRGRSVGAGCVLMLVGLLALPAMLHAQQIEYERPVSAAPTEEDIGEGYVTPVQPYYSPRPMWREHVDIAVLGFAMILGTWFSLKLRSRTAIVALAIGCLVYFGFYRKGCVCPIGAIQNVVVAFADPRYSVSYIAIIVFFLPLVFAVLFGRVFCGGVCPLGAVQELVLIRPVQVPRMLDRVLGSLKWVFLLLAVYFAALPAEDRDFIICRFDPFVGFFRFAGPMYMLLIGGGLIVIGLFVGRPYCRYLCPYGALLSVFARFSWRTVNITPDKELDCGLCAEACPYGAIHELRAVRSSCLSCARCYDHCPRQRIRETGGAAPVESS